MDGVGIRPRIKNMGLGIQIITIGSQNVHEVWETVVRVLKKISDYIALQQIKNYNRTDWLRNVQIANCTATMLENNDRKMGRGTAVEKMTRMTNKHETILCRRLPLNCWYI